MKLFDVTLYGHVNVIQMDLRRTMAKKLYQVFMHLLFMFGSLTRAATLCFGTVLNDIENITPLTGGFYSDDVGFVGDSCKTCPNGSFVQFDKTPGTSKEDCKSCPEGNNQTVIPKANA